jgi:hypothetical protein
MNSNFLPLQTTESRNTPHLARIFAAIISAALLAYPASAQFHVQLPTTTVIPVETQPQAKPQALPVLQAEIAPMPVQARDWPAAEAAALVALRGTSSPAEKKLSFNLFLLSRKARNGPLGSFATLLDSSQVGANGTLIVDITAYLSPSLMASPLVAKIVRENGGIPRPAYESDHLRARVSQRELLDLAANPNVLSITDFDSTKPAAAMASITSAPAISAAR